MTHRIRHSGFTLIELLVVITIIVVLAALSAIVVSGGLFDSYKNVGANDRVTGWLLTSKSWAQRDKSPRGVRFVIDPTTNLCKEAQYIEIPEPYYPAITDSANPPRIVIRRAGANATLYFTGAAADRTAFAANVTNGDTIQIAEFNLLLKVTGVGGNVTIPGTATQGRQINLTTATLLPQLGSATHYQTTSFVVHRQPQALMGEPMLQVPSGMVIDFNAGFSLANVAVNATDRTVDILFSSNGEVINTSSGITILWLRKDVPSASYTPAVYGGGLAAIYTKTGAIATHPINTATADPYLYAKDGINTGF